MNGSLLIAEPLQNHLLGALDAEARERLLPFLELVALTPGAIIHEAGDALRHAYFPIDLIVGLVYELESGTSVDIATVGNEGLIGTALFMGGESTPTRAVVLTGGHAYRLPGYRLKDEFNRYGALMRLLLRYMHARLTEVAQMAACNRFHSIDQQVCRWMLVCLDRVPGNRLNMSHGMIANMLGVRRESVTTAACKLQRGGVIDYSRGHITVLDRPRLETQSCECYAAVRKETERLLPRLPVPVKTAACIAERRLRIPTAQVASVASRLLVASARLTNSRSESI